VRPIEFRSMNGVAAENQREYLPLPMYRDNKYVISCWRMNLLERLVVLFTGVVWMRLFHSKEQSITPSLLEIASPWSRSKEHWTNLVNWIQTLKRKFQYNRSTLSMRFKGYWRRMWIQLIKQR